MIEIRMIKNLPNEAAISENKQKQQKKINK